MQATDEDIRRGTRFWIWESESHVVSFSPFPGAIRRCEIVAPIGWHPRPHKVHGVILRGVFSGGEATARQALEIAWATAEAHRFNWPFGTPSFRSVHWERVGS